MRDAKSCLRMMLVVPTILAVGNEKAYAARSRVPTWDLTFKGAASGGSLVLARNLNRTVKSVSISTSSGESAESVARRLAEAINSHAARDTELLMYDRHMLWVGGYQVAATGATVTLPLRPFDYMLGGTETGLGIPRPPVSLSARYDEGNNKIMLRWTNPPGGYDFVSMNGYYTDFDHEFARRLSGTSTTYVIDRKRIPVNVDDMDFRVVGFRNGIPSNAAAIHVARHSQEELYGIPFAAGVAPNWTPWSTAPEVDTARFQQAEKYPTMQGYAPARALVTKPFRQIIGAGPNGSMHGVYRKFLGLTPGHTYRLAACLTTLGMDSVKGDWSLSLCAAHNGPGGTDLTVQQLAGLAASPDGNSGPEAGRITFYERGRTTKGDHKLVFSDNPPEGGPESLNITLPGGADTITVWVRFTCSDPNGKVGFSGVKLEDITANPSPKTWQEIERAEYMEEASLLRREQKALQRSVR